MKFTTEPNQLTIKLEGMEQLWALKRQLQVPHYAIEDIDFIAQQPAMQDFKGYLRLPGTSLPGIFLAGSYNNKEGEREFWYLKIKTPGVLTIFIKDGTLKYDKIRVTCSPMLAQDIADWWQSTKKLTAPAA